VSEASSIPKAGIDHHETIGKQPRKMLWLTVWSRESDARGLRDIVDPNKNKIEAACPDARAPPDRGKTFRKASQ
jgi:hypothetical protein